MNSPWRHRAHRSRVSRASQYIIRRERTIDVSQTDVKEDLIYPVDNLDITALLLATEPRAVWVIVGSVRTH